MLQTANLGVNRSSSVNLSDQVASRLREAIQSGALPAGDRLPRVRELADQFGVSYRVANRAVQALASEGLLEVRRRTGISVAASPMRCWRAHALWVTPSVQSYYFATRQDALLAHLAGANIRTSVLSLPHAEANEMLDHFCAILDTQHISVVVSSHLHPGFIAECARRNVPLVAHRKGPEDQAAGLLVTSVQAALQDLAQHCRDLGVTRSAVLARLPQQCVAAESAFAAAGVALATIPTTPHWQEGGVGNLEQTEYLGYEAVNRLIRDDRLPELLYVTDDHVARGCLTALLQHGLRVPQDIQFVLHGNRRHLPVFGRPFTRIENDPVAAGDTLAALALAVLERPQATPHIEEVPARFIPGETTCPLVRDTRETT